MLNENLLARLSLAWLAGLIVLMAIPQAAAGNLDELRGQFTTANKRAAEEADSATAKLNLQLALALEKLENEVAQGGSLAPVVELRTQREAFQKDGDVSVIKSKAAESLVEIYRRQSTVADRQREMQLTELRKKYLSELKQLRQELTKAVEIDAAMAVDEEINQLEAEQSAKAPSNPKMRPERERMPKGSSNPFSEKRWEKSRHVQPGIYKAEVPAIDVKGSGLEAILDDIEIADIKMFVDEGKVLAKRCDFTNVKVPVDLGGRFEAVDTVFQECEFSKGGAMFVDRWSAKWSFKNCVFAKRFFRSGWHTTDISSRAEHCTFYDIDLGRYGFKDPGADAGSDQLAFRNCRFIDCKIHETILMTMEDCVFEGCRFTPADDDYEMSCELERNFFLQRTKGKKPSFRNPKVRATFFEQERLEAGANLEHTYRSGRIRR